MYKYLADAKKNMQKAEVSGTIGSLTFTGENIDRNSFKLINQCCNGSEFKFGGVFIGELDVKFINSTLNIGRNDWIGLEIAPVVTIEDESIPLGVYIVNSAAHSQNIVTVKAYDRMSKFDKAAAVSENMNGTTYDWLKLACMECGVPLGITREEVEQLPNGNQNFVLGILGDIQTWRDVIYWVTVSCGCFATMDRFGQLTIRQHGTDPVDTIPAQIRFNASSYGDEIVKYTGMNVVVQSDQTVEYYANEPDTEYSMNLGTNPFFQGTKAQRQVYMNNLLTVLPNIEFVPCAVSIPFGFHYDLGDVLHFPGGYGNATNKFCIMGYEYTYNGRCKLTGIPGDKKSKSKSDKDIQGLLNKVSKDEVASYEVKNTSIIRIGNNENKKLVSVRMASNTDTKALIHIEVNLESVAITPQTEYELEVDEETGITVLPFSNIWQDIADTVTHGIVTYLVNSEEVDLHPTESWVDGKHVLHLMYVLGVQQGITSTFDAYMKSEGGTIMIQRGGVWLYAQGVGLVGDGKWDGTIKLEDELSGWSLIEIGFDSASDRVTVNTQAPVSISLSDNASGWQLVELGFESAGDVLNINMYTETYVRVTEEENTRITEDGLTRFTEGD